MILEINKKEYEVATSLGVAYEIEKNKKKKVVDAVADENLTLDDMLAFIYCGFKKKNPEIKFEEFRDLVLDSDNLGYVEVSMEFQVFCNLLLSRKETEEEIRAKLAEALENEQNKANKELKRKN